MHYKVINICCIGLFVALIGGGVFVFTTSQKQNDNFKEALQSRVIIKLNDTLTASEISSTLDEFKNKYDIYKIEQTFKNVSPRDEIIKKYPERSKRIPKGVKTPSLKHTYVIIFNEQFMDTQQLIMKLTEDQRVEYAHPDHIQKIQEK